MYRPFLPVLGLAAGIAAVAAFAPAVSAAPKAAPSPSPAATTTPEPLDKAIPRLESHLKIQPDDKDAQGELAGDYLQIGRPDLALALSQKLLAEGVKTARTYYLDGVAQSATHHDKEALADLENAANLEPTNPDVLGYLTSMYLQRNRPQDAERVAKRAVTFNPNDENALLAYGSVLATEQKYDQARQEYEAAAKVAPKDARPLMLEAQTYVQQNAIALAGQYYDKATQIDPTSEQAWVGKARLQASEHDVTGAMQSYDALLKLAKTPVDQAAVIDQEAITYANEKMNAQADALYRKAIADYPTVLTTHVAYGDYLASAGDKAGAEREYTAALGPNKDDADAVARLGSLYQGENQLGKAQDQFKRLVALAPNDPRSHLLLAQSYAAGKQFDKARDEFKTAYGLQHSPDALLGLGEADYQTHQYAECAAVYDALDRNLPQLERQNPSLLFRLGQCYAQSNQKTKAKDAYTRLLGYLPAGSQNANQVHALIAKLDKKPAPAKKKKDSK